MTKQTATAAQTSNSCRCSAGCPATTTRFFSQGHDARMVSRLIDQVVATEGEFAQFKLADALKELHQRGGTDALAHKLRCAVAAAHDTWLKRADAKAARAAKKAQPKQPAPVQGKVGRWVYTGHVVDGEFVYTDAKGAQRTATKFTLV
jgi:hypothetical protein